ncbi:MAG TPA: DnaJ domain-containing protein [Candidatus Kapabacteria bacterium]|nr:DnaJ domain-containing protein [Candidatus Kapabacteria bacterium]HPO62786.1 DnaJ domain-containing protein [Candidatus Kapabacteria bacterium]
MGQIFDRLKNIIKSEVNFNDEVNYDFEKQSEDDLKRIIDELNKKKKTKQNTENQNNHQQENFQKQQYSLDDAYKILEINENSNIEEIKAAYKKKIKEYHPDRLSGLGAELQQIAHQKTQEINSAYNFLKKIKGFS